MCELTEVKECLVAKICEQFEDIDAIDTVEMKEAIDMVKDLAQAIYYCTVVKSMEEGGECDSNCLSAHSGDEHSLWLYHTGATATTTSDSSSGTSDVSKHKHKCNKGRCGCSRASYLEKKEENESASYLSELEVYLSDLKNDIKEMAIHMNYDEKELVGNHLSILHSEIV